jgi:hypothetical protein
MEFLHDSRPDCKLSTRRLKPLEWCDVVDIVPVFMYSQILWSIPRVFDCLQHEVEGISRASCLVHRCKRFISSLSGQSLLSTLEVSSTEAVVSEVTSSAKAGCSWIFQENDYSFWIRSPSLFYCIDLQNPILHRDCSKIPLLHCMAMNGCLCPHTAPRKAVLSLPESVPTSPSRHS